MKLAKISPVWGRISRGGLFRLIDGLSFGDRSVRADRVIRV